MWYKCAGVLCGCVCVYVDCCCGADNLVTLSGFLMFHYCGLPVAECIIYFSLWFLVLFFSITNPPAGQCELVFIELLPGIGTSKTLSGHLKGCSSWWQ